MARSLAALAVALRGLGQHSMAQKSLYEALTLAAESGSLEARLIAVKDLKTGLKSTGSIEASAAVGKAVAERAKSAGVSEVVFDRGGYRFHGRIKALADAAREAGLVF